MKVIDFLLIVLTLLIPSTV